MGHSSGITALPLFLTDDDINQLADWQPAIDAIRNAYSAEVDEKRNPGRIFAQSEVEWERIMPAIPATGETFGYKSIVGSFDSGLTVSYLIALFDKKTAALVALLDGNRVTGLRTAATTAVGASLITPSRNLSVGIIGSGFEARSHLEALSTISELGEISVFSPTQSNREKFASDFSGVVGTSVRASNSAQEAVEGCDLVLCAARSTDETPTVQSDWIAPGTAVISIGSTTPAQRELPTDLIDRADLIVVDTFDEVVHGSGDMLAAGREGIDVESRVVTLSEALRDEKFSFDEGAIRIYKSTGAGLQDIVVGEMLYQLAREREIGTTIPVGIVTSKK